MYSYRFCLVLLLLSPLSYRAYKIEQNTTDTAVTTTETTDSAEIEDDAYDWDCRCDIQTSVLSSLVDELKEVKHHLNAIEKRELDLPMYCLDAAAGSAKSGIYEIFPNQHSDESFEVFCDEEYYENAEGGGWTVIQRRIDASVGFYRSWDDYKVGFGDLAGNFWLGLDKLHVLTSSCEHELYIVLQRFDKNAPLYARYDWFVIDGEKQNYKLSVLGGYQGTAGDSLIYHKGMSFSTWDRDNDNSLKNCAREQLGAWWYNNCQSSNLNGVYKPSSNRMGINWITIKGQESLKFTQMMIRPTKNCIMRLAMLN